MKYPTVSYSAPGHIPLAGGGLAMYGNPVVSCAVQPRLTCVVEIGTNINDQTICKSVVAYLTNRKEKIRSEHPRISITSDVPVVLGRAEAWTATVAAALIEFYTGRIPNTQEIISLAHHMLKSEKRDVYGIGVSTVCQGGVIYFRKEFEFLKTISALHMKVPPIIQKNLFIAYHMDSLQRLDFSKVAGDFLNTDPKAARAVLSDIERITKQLVISISIENQKMFVKSLQEYERLRLRVCADFSGDREMKLFKDKFSCMSQVGSDSNPEAFLLYSTNDTAEEIMKQHDSIGCLQFVTDNVGLRRE